MFIVTRNPNLLELQPMTQLRLLGLSGSLRRASNGTAVLRGLQNALAPKAALDIFSLQGLPLYNEDDDGEYAPESVRALRSAIETTGGVIMVSPEYNHGMSGVLKNALDWASRPYGRSVLRSKPVLTMTTSPAFTGGVRAQQQMNETLASIPARPVLRPQIVIAACMRRSATGASSTRPRCALRWKASMTSSTRSGPRALFERRHEVTTAMPMPGGDVRVGYWHVVLQTPKCRRVGHSGSA
jgi:chromate reductase